MGKRIDILNSLYDHLSNVVGYSWEPLYSTGNGSINLIDDAGANFKYLPESNNQDKGQSLYFLTSTVEIRAYKRYTLGGIEDNDIRVEEVRSDMVEQLRYAFGLETVAMCQAGINRLNYVREDEPDISVSDMVQVKMEIEIEWRDDRSL